MNINKILGFILLAAGIAIIGGTLLFSWQIFSGQNGAPQVFSFEQDEKSDPGFSLGSLEDLGSQLPALLEGQLEGLLPSKAIPQMLNLVVWSMFAGILLFAGSLVASLGIKLVK